VGGWSTNTSSHTFHRDTRVLFAVKYQYKSILYASRSNIMGRTLWSEASQTKWEAENVNPLVTSSKATQTNSKPNSNPEQVSTWFMSPFDVDAPLRDDHVYEAFIDPSASIASPLPNETEDVQAPNRTDCPESLEQSQVEEFEPPVTPSSAVFHTLTLPLTLPSGRGRNSTSPSPSSSTSRPFHLGTTPRSTTAPNRPSRTRLSAIQSLTPRYNELEVALQF